MASRALILRASTLENRISSAQNNLYGTVSPHHNADRNTLFFVIFMAVWYQEMAESINPNKYQAAFMFFGSSISHGKKSFGSYAPTIPPPIKPLLRRRAGDVKV